MSGGPINRWLYRWIHRVWYEEGRGGWLLRPFSLLYSAVIQLRALLYERGILSSTRVPVPVIVVGNITAGGTGKTPVVIWLVEQLRAKGFVPGVVSRGYGGSHSGASMRVDQASDPGAVGDEPLLIANRCGCPVVVDSDRARAAEMLQEDGVTVVITDDGLQHRRLQRDVEICVVDGARGLGNRRLLPAGPLRESVDRLERVDQVLVNGELSNSSAATPAEQNALGFHLVASNAVRLDNSLVRPLAKFANSTVHAVAGIGNPQRFFDDLRAEGMQVIEHPLRDHEPLTSNDLEFGDSFDVLMTEKDAVKLGNRTSQRLWYVPIDLQMESTAAAPFIEQIESRIRRTDD